MSRTIVKSIKFSTTDPSKLANSAKVAGYDLKLVTPTEDGAIMVFENASATNPEATATYFEAQTGTDITP